MKTVFILLFVFFQLLSAQDNVRVYMLSRDVGTVIDREERNEHNLFPNLKDNFFAAFFFMDKDSVFYIQYHLVNSTPYDSVTKYPFGSFYSSAVRVQAAEHKKRGAKFDITRTLIEYKDTTIVFVHKDTEGLRTVIEKEKLRELELTTPLPLADLELDAENLLRGEYEWYFGLGAGYKPGGFQGVREQFNYFELNEPDPGYSLPLTTTDFSVGMLFNVTSMVSFRRFLSLELGFTLRMKGSDDIEYRSYRLSGAYYYKLNENLRPYVSAGYTRVAFSVRQNYYMAVKESYPILEYYRINSEQHGLELSAGVLYELSPVTALNFSTGYKIMKSPVMYDAHQQRITASGFETAVTFLIR